MISNQDAVWRLMSLCESCKHASIEECDNCLVEASIEAFNIKDRLEQADAQIIADNFCDEVCNGNKCQEGVRCDYAKMTKLLAEKILADLRGDADDDA